MMLFRRLGGLIMLNRQTVLAESAARRWALMQQRGPWKLGLS